MDGAIALVVVALIRRTLVASTPVWGGNRNYQSEVELARQRRKCSGW
jgi:hypothetical protein